MLHIIHVHYLLNFWANFLGIVPTYKSGLAVEGQQIDILISRSKIFFSEKYDMDVNLSEIYNKKEYENIFTDEKICRENLQNEKFPTFWLQHLDIYYLGLLLPTHKSWWENQKFLSVHF